MKKNKRIVLLDGFRCIAILMVLICHYTSFSTIIQTNTGKTEVRHYWWEDGRLGVQLFFIISGFVIFLTLEKSKSIIDFFLKRLIRIYPMLIIASIVAFVFPMIIDKSNAFPDLHPPARAFFASLTLTDLLFSKLIFHKEAQYIDGVHWTLVVEMKFYLLSSLFFFINKAKFLYNWFIFTIVSIVLFCLASRLHYANAEKILDRTLLSTNIIYFTAGIYFHTLFQQRKVSNNIPVLLALSIFLEVIFIWTFHETVYSFLFFILFLIFIYNEKLLSFLGQKIFTLIGISSYSLYLLHGSFGAILKLKLAEYFNVSPIAFWLVISVSLLVVFVSYLSFKYIENPMGAKLKRKIEGLFQ